MVLILNGNTSQDFWRLVYPAHRKPGYDGLVSAESLAESEWAVRECDVWSMAPAWINESFLAAGSGVLGCLARGEKSRRRSRTHWAKVWGGPIPEGSLYELGNGVFVSSPPFTFLQMADQMDLVELIAYGFELCGYYGFDRDNPRGTRARPEPLCTIRQITDYLASAKGCRGRGLAQRAARFVIGGSASPMETLDAMLLSLPYRLGGYGIPAPYMNLEIPLDAHAAAIAKRSSCYADMCYPDIRLDLEHHGRYDHFDEASFESDRARVNGLKAMGYEVIELTSKQVADLHAFEEIVVYTSKRLGKRLDRDKLGATPARIKLRSDLLAWNQRHGHPAR